MAQFDMSVLTALIVSDRNTVIGNRDNTETVTKVLGDIGRLSYVAASKAVAAEDINYCRRNSMTVVEESTDERRKSANRFYEMAGKKILFLNAECKRLGHGYFVRTKVDKTSIEELTWLVEDFMDLIGEF